MGGGVSSWARAVCVVAHRAARPRVARLRRRGMAGRALCPETLRNQGEPACLDPELAPSLKARRAHSGARDSFWVLKIP